MSGLCVAVAAGLALLAPGDAFRLAWTHSVEKVEWREEWRVAAGRLELVEASVAGSAAGMEPPPEAVFAAGRWVWHPRVVRRELVLARSGFTADWRLCIDGTCRPLETLLPEKDGQATLVACPD
jgi:hypothetical protein